MYIFTIVVANWRLDNAKSPAAMIQEKTARTPHTLCVAGGSARYPRSHAVRTYIPQVGHLFSSFDMLYVWKRKHSTAQQHRKNNVNETEKFGKKKNPPPSHLIFFCLIGTPCTGQKIKKSNSRASLSASYAACPSRDRLATDSVWVKLSLLSATVSLVARFSLSPVLTVAVVRQLDNVVAQTGSSVNFSPVAKISTA